MPDVSDLLGGKFLSAENVPQPFVLTIAGAERIQMDGQTRLTLQFAELPKGLLCNKINLGVVAKLCGTDTTQWVGRQVVLQSEPVQFQGKTVQGLRVKPWQQPVAPVQPVRPVTPQPAPQQAEPIVPPDLHQQQPVDDCPF
jgi:hypothetical protein